MLEKRPVLAARRGAGRYVLALLAGLLLAGCSREPVNSPYAKGAAQENTLYTAFTQRSRKYLDPAS